MPVHMIELEEIAMMGVNDEALEALISPLKYASTQDGDVTGGCPW